MADPNTLKVRVKSAYHTETEWNAITTIPELGEVLYTKTGPRDGYFKIGDGSHQWKDLDYIKPSYDYSEINPISTKTFSGIYGSENNFANATFYFASLRPKTWTDEWHVKYRIYATIPNQSSYTGWFDVDMYGAQASRLTYKCYNSHYSTGARSLYFHVLYSLTSKGFDNGYGHLLGIGLRSSHNPTSSSYPRTFKIDIMEADNCTVTFNDTMLKFANVPGTGSTNYNGYSEYNGADNGLQESGDSNDTTTLQYANARLTAGSNGLPGYSITMMKPDGTWEGLTTGNATTATTSPKNTSGFVLGQMYLYWSGTNIAAGSITGTSVIRTTQDWVDMRYTLNCGTTLISNQMVYLKGTTSNGLFYLADGIYTQTLPTSNDGFIYIPIGMCYGNGYSLSFWGWHGAYYHDGTNLREFIVDNATQSKSGLMSAADKKKLDGIAEGANKYVLPVATDSAIGGVKSGTDISVDSSGNVSVKDNSHNHTIANVTNLQTTLDGKAPKASPEFTGTPKAPTADAGTSTTQIATTAFVQNAVNSAAGDIEIGGRNYLLRTPNKYNQADYSAYQLHLTENLVQDETYTLQLWGVDVSHSGKTAAQLGIWVYWGGGSIDLMSFSNTDFIDGHADHLTKTFTVTPEQAARTSAGASNKWLVLYNSVPYVSGTLSMIVDKWKLEKGNKSTDWTPAPEDLVSSLFLSGSTLSYNNAVGVQAGSMTLSKSTVGLGNVDNTSDKNKPISTATQTALDQISNTIGNAKLFTGVCSTAADQVAKAVTCSQFKATDLVKGTRISVYFDHTNSAAVANLTLNVNNTGAKPIKHIYNGLYSTIPQPNYIREAQIYNFTYDGTNWVIDIMQNTDSDWRVRSDYGRYTAGTAGLFPNTLVLQTPDGCWESIVTTSTTNTNKQKNTHGFLLGSIFYKNGGSAVSSGNIDSTWGFNSCCVTDARYHFNIENTSASQLVSGCSVYLVGTIDNNGLFYLDDTWWSQSLPTSDDGKYYIYLGAVYSWYQYNLDVFHPIFKYSNNSVKQVTLDSLKVNGHTVESNVPSGAVFTDYQVTQKLYSANNDMPLLMSYNTINATTTDTTNYVHRNNSIYANPSTGKITASSLKSNSYMQAKNKLINVASSYDSGVNDEIIIYTGIKFVSSNLMPLVHITGYAYGMTTPIDLNIVFYIYDNKLCNQGVTDSGGFHPDVYLFKYTKDSVDYVAIALKTSSAIYYPTINVDVLNEALGALNNIDPLLFKIEYIKENATSVIPEPDNGVTCIQVPYKINYNPKPTLTIQANSSTINKYDGTDTVTVNITKSSIGLSNVENKSSATIRGELTSSNVTTALGNTPVNRATNDANGNPITTSYVNYGGNDTGLGSGTTAEKAKEYFADTTKVPAGMVKFFYNNSGAEFTTIFSKAPDSGYGSALKWGYQDQYLRILRYQANAWKTEDWEKIYAGYADSAGYTTNLRSSIVDINNGGNVDDLLTGSDLTFTKVSHLNIGWGGNDGLILNIPWNTAYGRQIALDDNSSWMATRAKNNTSGWTEWDRILTKSYGDTLYLSKTGTHAHIVTDLSFGTEGLSGSLDPITAYNIGPSASNKTFGLPAEAITVEYSTDAGATWQDYGLSDYGKKALFAETREQWIYAGKNSTSGQGSTNYWLRVTIYPSDGRYAYVNGLYLWVSRAGVTATVDLQRSTRGNPDTFTEVFSGQDIAGWSGNNIRYFSSNSFGGGTSQTSNGYKYRMIFKITSITDANYGTLSVSDIRFLGSSVFSFPSGNYMMKHNRLYNWDAYQNATFPANLTAKQINGTGGMFTGDITLQASSGNSPAIIFQRGTLTDTLNDWEIRDKGGILYFGQRGSDSTAFDTGIYLDNSAGVHATTFHGSLSGNATSATAASYLKIVANNELRFDVATKPSAEQTLHIGYAWSDGSSDAKITRYLFENGATAKAEVEASTFYGNLVGNVTGNVTGNSSTATTATTASLLKPIASTTTASASTWSIPSGSVQVWGERFSDSSLTYTSDGTTKTITDTGDLVMWLTPSSTSNTATLNMRIDGTYYGSFNGSLTGHASSDLALTGGTLTGSLTISGGKDLILKAGSSAIADAGDIVFQNNSGAEIGRIWNNSGSINVRLNSTDGTVAAFYNDGLIIYKNYIAVSPDNDINSYLNAGYVHFYNVQAVTTPTLVGIGTDNNTGYLVLSDPTGGAVPNTAVTTPTFGIWFNTAKDTPLMRNSYNDTNYNLIRNHNNGNISISASSAGLYLGYENTTFVNFLNGKMSLNSDGFLTILNARVGTASASSLFTDINQGAVAVRYGSYNALQIVADAAGTVRIWRRTANNTSFNLISCANNSNVITAGGDWTFSNTITGNISGNAATSTKAPIKVQVMSNDNLSVAANSRLQTDFTPTIPSGYSIVGITGIRFDNASSSGANSSNMRLQNYYLTNNLMRVWGYNDGAAAKVKVTVLVVMANITTWQS